jgi:hypothetical protein
MTNILSIIFAVLVTGFVIYSVLPPDPGARA